MLLLLSLLWPTLLLSLAFLGSQVLSWSLLVLTSLLVLLFVQLWTMDNWTSMEYCCCHRPFFHIPFATGVSYFSSVPVVVGVPVVVNIPSFYGVFTGSDIPAVGVS
jgi:hypothetical protein